MPKLVETEESTNRNSQVNSNLGTYRTTSDIRTDAFGCEINKKLCNKKSLKKKKKYKVSFIDQINKNVKLVEIIEVESYKAENYMAYYCPYEQFVKGQEKVKEGCCNSGACNIF